MIINTYHLLSTLSQFLESSTGHEKQYACEFGDAWFNSVFSQKARPNCVEIAYKDSKESSRI